MWQQLANQISHKPGICMLWGAADTGKSTLAAFLSSYCTEREQKVAVVDADVGQSDIGLPGTIGMGFVTGVISRLSDITGKKRYFVGDNNPNGLEMISAIGTYRMVQSAIEMGADVVIIDTTGATQGRQARVLKHLMFEIVHPDYLISLQQNSELEHLLKGVELSSETALIRCPQLPGVRRRSSSERRLLRQKAFGQHFASFKEHRLDLDEITFSRTFFRTGDVLLPEDLYHLTAALNSQVLHAEIIPEGLCMIVENKPEKESVKRALNRYGCANATIIKEKEFSRVLIGLADNNGRFVGTGILIELNFPKNQAVILSNPEISIRTHQIHLGRLRVTKSGKELGKLQHSLTYVG